MLDCRILRPSIRQISKTKYFISGCGGIGIRARFEALAQEANAKREDDWLAGLMSEIPEKRTRMRDGDR